MGMFGETNITAMRTDLAGLIMTGRKVKEYTCGPLNLTFKLKTLSVAEEAEVFRLSSQYAHDALLRLKLDKPRILATATEQINNLVFKDHDEALQFFANMQTSLLEYFWTCYADLIQIRNMEMEEATKNIKKSSASPGPEGSGPSSQGA